MKFNGKRLLLISVLAAGLFIGLQSYYAFLKHWNAIAILMILLALSLSLLTTGQEKKIVRIAPAGLILATIVKIIIDGIADPTSHNLWPFEIILLSLLGFAAALIGAGISLVVKWILKSSKK